MHDDDDPFSTFDDSLFASSNVDGKESKLKKTYNAKVCSDLWFMQECYNKINVDEQSSKEDVIVLKHQADFYYYNKQWIKALDIYLQIIKGSDSQRSCHEEAVKCLLALNHPQVALPHAQHALEQQVGLEQKVPIYILLSDVHIALHNMHDACGYIERAICQLPTNPDLWRRLSAVCLGNCVCSSTTGDVRSRESDGCFKCQLTGITAALRARNLYHYLDRQNKGFVFDRSKHLAEQLNDTLQSYASVFKLDDLEVALQKYASDRAATASDSASEQGNDATHVNFMSRFLPFLSDFYLYTQ